MILNIKDKSGEVKCEIVIEVDKTMNYKEMIHGLLFKKLKINHVDEQDKEMLKFIVSIASELIRENS
jgi:hypothetical protein